MLPPTDLPVEKVVPEVRAALADHGSAVVVAPPGAGKTTLLPLRLLDEPWLDGARIVVLEPRRLATRAAARRMAELLGEEVGATVGYRTRDERVVGRDTRVEVVTEGILTRRLQHDPSLPGTGLVVFDEIHERNLQADLGLAFVADARPVLRPDLRVLAMSATVDAAPVAALLDGSPVVTSAGRTHPVDVRWLPRRPKERAADAATKAVLLALRQEPGDVLVFLAGAGDIRRVEQALRGTVPHDVDVRPLFGALSAGDQDLALRPSPPGRRRVVLATDIAETSLTVEGVRIVVDAGEARSPRFDARTGLTTLATGPISKASAEQRAGRAGRLGPGVAYRLWSKLEHAARRPFTPAEITAVDLAGTALELALWGTPVEDLRFLDAPPARALEEGRTLLRRLGALDADGRATAVGRRMAELPLHPRLAHMVVAADDLHLAGLACVVGALLEERDVFRGRPDEVPVDVTERARLVLDRDRSHPAADGAAVAGARRRAADLARRIGVRLDDGSADVTRTGVVLALAYPDRIAQARGNGRFRLRTGTGAWVAATDPLVTEPFVVVADLDAGKRDARIRMAAALDADDVELAAGAEVTRSGTVAWDGARNDLRSRVEHRLDGLVLRTAEGPAPAGPATEAALLARVRANRLADLGWSDAARSLQQRAAFARRHLGEGWPDLGDAALLDELDEWLAPALAGATGRADLERVDMRRILRGRLGHQKAADLERVAPSTLTLPSGRSVPIDYAGDQPAVSVRVQDAFGITAHPTVAGVPVLFSLLSPAGRPVQVTADLPGFWLGSWAAVRKEMAGRYPKHAWPERP